MKGAEFERDREGNENEDLYSEAIVEEDLDLQEAQEQQLLENTSGEKPGRIIHCDSDPEFDIPPSNIKGRIIAKSQRMAWKQSDKQCVYFT